MFNSPIKVVNDIAINLIIFIATLLGENVVCFFSLLQ